MKKLLVLLPLLAGCNDYKPPHWEDVCVSSLTVYQPRGDKIVVSKVCVKAERMCVVGRLYVGSMVCPKESTT